MMIYIFIEWFYVVYYYMLKWYLVDEFYLETTEEKVAALKEVINISFYITLKGE